MIKKYTDREYAEKAWEANSQGKILYVYEYKEEYEAEVLEWDYRTETRTRQKVDEQGNPMYDKDGNPIMETYTVEVPYPKMVIEIVERQKVDEQGNPMYDKDGNPIMEEVEVEVQAHHTETFTREVAELKIADKGYYICYDGNITDGTVNPNYEEEKAARERERILKLSMTKLDLVTCLEGAGITYAQVKELIEANEEAKKQWDLCERVYRFNPMLETLAATIGVTSEQLDAMFIEKNT